MAKEILADIITSRPNADIERKGILPNNIY